MTKPDYFLAHLYVKPTVLAVFLFQISCRSLASYSIWAASFLNFYQIAASDIQASSVWIFVVLRWVLIVILGLLTIWLTVEVGLSPERTRTSPMSTGLRTVLIAFMAADIFSSIARMELQPQDFVIPLILWHDYALIMNLPKPPKRKRKAKGKASAGASQKPRYVAN